MSEIRVTSVVGESGGDRVGLTTGLTVGPLTGTTGIGATITHQGHAQFAGVCTATSFVGSGANLTGLPASGLFSSYAIIGDQKSSGTAGGGLTHGDWRTHDLQTEFSDSDGIVSISSNQFTLQAGTYFITYKSIAYAVNSAVCKIYNVTDSADVANSFSQSVYARNSSGHTIPVIGSVRFTISGAKVFELRQQGTVTHSSAGFGVAHSFSVNIYAIIEIFKEN